jgi:carboxylesterase type B
MLTKTVQMQKMAASMDPSKLASMGIDPSTAVEQLSNLSPADMARAREQVRCQSDKHAMRGPDSLAESFVVTDEKHDS